MSTQVNVQWKYNNRDKVVVTGADTVDGAAYYAEEFVCLETGSESEHYHVVNHGIENEEIDENFDTDTTYEFSVRHEKQN